MEEIQQSDAPLQAADNKSIEKIAIFMAMPEEAEPVIEFLQFQKFDLGLDTAIGLQSYKVLRQNREIYLIVNGCDSKHGVPRVGSEQAILAANEILRTLKPDLLINAGTAGGYASKGAAIGDIIIGTSSCYHDHQIPISKEYESYSRGNYPCLSAAAITNAFNFLKGVISTGNAFEPSETDLNRINNNNAIAKDMEAAAVAGIAERRKTPVMLIKAVTNLVAHKANAIGQFNGNFPLATSNLAKALAKIIDALLGKTLKQLQTPLCLINRHTFHQQPSHMKKIPKAPSKRFLSKL